MFWRKKAVSKTTKNKKSEPKTLSKSNSIPHSTQTNNQEKWIELKIPCYLLVEKTGYFLETTTIKLSKNGIQVQSLKPLENGQEVVCLLSNKRNLSANHMKGNKFNLKANVVQVEPETILYRMSLQISLGRVDPAAFLENVGDDKYWWTRHWQ